MTAILLILAVQTASPPSTAPVPAPNADVPQGQSTYVDLEAGVGYATNPLLRFGDDTGAAFGRASVSAVHKRVSERTTTVLSAYGQSIFYTNHYGSQQSADLSARHDARVNEKLRVFGDLSFSYDEGGQLDTRIRSIPNVPLTPGAVVPPDLLSPGGDFLSVTGKQYRASGHVGAQWSLSARDSLTLSSGLDHIVSKNGLVDTRYDSIPASVGWDRQISPRTTLGARVSAVYTDYNGPATVRSVTPEVTVSTKLSERITFAGAIGATFSAVDDGFVTHHSTGLAADGTLCRLGETDSLCARFSVDQSTPTAIGPSRSISLGLDYSKQLNDDDSFHLSAGLNKYSTPTSFVSGESFSRSTYFRAAADYSRRLGGRLFAGANLSARKLIVGGPDPKADVTGSAFIRYRIGDIR